jgi:hypothetical protein
MPRIIKKSVETAPSTSIDKLASEVMSLLNADASAHKTKTAKKTQKIPVPSEPVEKKKPVKKTAPAPAPATAPVSETTPATKKRVFKPLSAEHKQKVLEYGGQEGISKTHIRKMKSHLMLGKTWDEAHTLVSSALATEPAKTA